MMEHSEIACLQIQGTEDLISLHQDCHAVCLEPNAEEIVNQTCASQNTCPGIMLLLKSWCPGQC